MVFALLIAGIPSFHILDENLKTINDEGRGAVGADPEGKEFPWVPKPLNPLLGHTAGKVNSCATMIYLTGKVPLQASQQLCNNDLSHR